MKYGLLMHIPTLFDDVNQYVPSPAEREVSLTVFTFLNLFATMLNFEEFLLGNECEIC
jgi:hypothetical protein